MQPDVVAALRCPVCRAALVSSAGALRCGAGHAFDLARQGYVSFLVGRPTAVAGDDAAMLAARARFLGAGHFAPLAQALAAIGRDAAPGLAVEVGAGTAYYLSQLLELSPGRAGLAVDVSRNAARHAARAHPRLDAIVADARTTLPVADACAGVVLDVFAPRNGREFRRILRHDGALVVVTPAPEHLGELRSRLGLLAVDADKERRLATSLEPWLCRASSTELRWTMRLPRADALALAAMGPSAHHLDPAELAGRVAALPDPTAVSAAVTISVWRGGPPGQVSSPTAP